MYSTADAGRYNARLLKLRAGLEYPHRRQRLAEWQLEATIGRRTNVGLATWVAQLLPLSVPEVELDLKNGGCRTTRVRLLRLRAGWKYAFRCRRLA